tara:strand:- start:103 stop:333 length:231 start_codon:yes stop_codon:yes gene_type:complete
MILEPSHENQYNNADSFAMAFDAAWKECALENDKDINVEDKIQKTFSKIKTHPFLINRPIQSKDIAHFRIKLLGLS